MFVNIFGGIMRCDIIADGIIKAASSLADGISIVVRLKGTNVDEAQKKMAQSGLKIHSAEDMTEAAKLCVKLAASQ